jgi:hypothetical protein
MTIRSWRRGGLKNLRCVKKGKETGALMKNVLLLILVASSCAYAQAQGNVSSQGVQEGGNAFFYQTQGPGSAGAVSVSGFAKGPGAAPVQGAPYSATVVNESIQTLADGNRIVISDSGAIARDSLGRTRQETVLPAIGNLSPANAPHLVFIQDPVAQTSYTLNLADKTAQKMPLPSTVAMQSGPAGGPSFTTMIAGGPMPADGPMPPPPPLPAKGFFFIHKEVNTNEPAQTATEDLGSKTMEGVLAYGTRTTHIIPAGQIGNEKPIEIVTEVWTSPDLKAVVYSKRSDPRMGEQTFRLTDVTRTEPDPSLFTVPSDFKVIDGPQPIVYSPKQ